MSRYCRYCCHTRPRGEPRRAARFHCYQASPPPTRSTRFFAVDKLEGKKENEKREEEERRKVLKEMPIVDLE